MDAPPQESLVPSSKKARLCGPGEVRRVAEIVLVLSALAQVRGGRTPTPEEEELMVEARDKMAGMCQDLPPRDILSGEVVGNVMEVMGLNAKAKDLRLGFRATRLTIAEKMALAKRKLEDCKKFTPHPATYSSHPLQKGYGTAAENRGTSDPVRAFSSDKHIHTPIPAGSFPASTPLSHAPAAPSTSLSYQFPSNKVRASVVSSGLRGSNLGRDSSLAALPKVERGLLKVDGGSNGTSYASPCVRANSSAECPLVNYPTWSVYPLSASSAKSGPDNKWPNQTLAKVEGTIDTNLVQMAPQAARDQTFWPFITQTPSGSLSPQPLPAMNIGDASSYTHHDEIAKIVQTVLRPQLPDHPTWTPPSRDYMSKPLGCFMCQRTVTEVETVLLCDACEKGYHLKCLQPYNQKGIPRGAEWHCPKCLQLSSGKPLPPKYGRVMRNLSSLKTTCISAEVQSSSEKKSGTSDLKASQQKIITNESNTVQSLTPTSANFINHADVPYSSKIPNVGRMQGNNLTSSTHDVDEKPSLVTYQVISAKQMGGQHIQPYDSSEQVPESRPQSVGESSDTVPTRIGHMERSDNPQSTSWTAFPQCVELTLDNQNSVVRESDKSAIEIVDTASVCSSKIDGLDISQSKSILSKNGNSMVRDLDKSFTTDVVDKTSVCSANRDAFDILQSISSNVTREISSFDRLPDVGWIGDALQVVDGKTVHKSCSVGGVMYEVQDYAVFRFNHDKLAPSRLKAMWENNKTGSKWVIVNRCYFPSDLPKVVGCPPAPESNEVYESTHDITMMASLIQGPCKVLPTTNFKEERERREQLDTETNGGTCPVFLCKWLYDELKGSFQPISTKSGDA